jgi:hypothetical protein
MFRPVAAVLLVLASVSGADARTPSKQSYVDPVVAIPLNRSLLDNPSAFACFAQLLALGGYGQRSDERAAFLIFRDDGSHSYDCMLWPAQHAFRREQWSGRIPPGTVAILHTHPEGNPDPSPHDAMEAQRLSVPIFAITPGDIELVEPRDGRIVILAHGHGWWKRELTAGAQTSRSRE